MSTNPHGRRAAGGLPASTDDHDDQVLLRTSIAALAGTIGLALTAGCSAEGSGGLLGTPTEVGPPPPPSLGEGPLRQIATHGMTARDSTLSDLSTDGVLETDDMIVVLTQPDNSLAAYARDTGREVWRVVLPRDETTDQGACFGPRRSAPDHVTVFIGTGCPLMMTYDLATGALEGKETVYDKYIMADGTTQTDPSPDAYFPVEGDVQGAVELDGRVWFLTRDFLGYVDDDGKPVRTLEPAQLGIGGELSDHVYGTALGARPEDHQVVVGMLHSKASQEVSDRQWRGITIVDPAAGKNDPDLRAKAPTATPAWFLDETDGSSLGITDLAPRKAPILLRTEDPGTPLAVGLTGKRVGLTRVDATTGQATGVAVVPKDRGTSVTDSGTIDRPEIAWADGVLFTSSGAAGSSPFRRWGIDAYDLTTGTERWHVELPSPPGLAKGDTFYLRDLQLAADGSLYAVTGDGFVAPTLRRVNPATGELTGTWDLPKELSDREYDFVVAGDIVIALSNSPYDEMPSMVMLSTNDDLAPSPSDASTPTGTTSPSP